MSKNNMTSRERVFAMINGKPVDRLPLMPITMQFACDRIGRKYYEYLMDYRVLVEAQLKVSELFAFDQLACVSDPAREASDLGAAVNYREDGPAGVDEKNALLADKSRLAKLKVPDPLGGGRMHDRVKACALFREKAGDEKIIEGWIEGPCAEGADLRGISVLMMDFYEDPQFIRDLFEFAIEMDLAFAEAQIKAGANLMGIGDAAASLIGPKLYKEFVWPYEKRLIDDIHKLGCAVRLHICGNIRDLLEDIGKLGCEIVDIDHPVPVSMAKKKMGTAPVIIGNLDPVAIVQDSTPEQIYKVIEKCHKEAGKKFIVGLGCEVTRGTPIENLRVLTEYALSH